VSGFEFETKPVKGECFIRNKRLDPFGVESENKSIITGGKRFIESPKFPFAKISKVSAGEKGRDRPPKKRR
jgi:hypothetical protein